jgi:hypothetical protein
MNRYILIRRLTGPAILLLIGILALLSQAHLVSFWGLFFPLLLILIGVLKLAERAALASVGPEAGYPGAYPGYPGNPGAPYPYGAATNAGGVPPQTTAQSGTAMVQTPPDLGKGPEGGQS